MSTELQSNRSQIHLSTAIALMLTAAVLMKVNCTPYHRNAFTYYGWPVPSYVIKPNGSGSFNLASVCFCGIPAALFFLFPVWFTLEACIKSRMSSVRAILMVAASAALFGLGGTLVGLLIALTCPDYYYVMFSHERGFNPVQLGIGLGLTEGGLAGMVIGVVAVLLEAWHRRVTLQESSRHAAVSSAPGEPVKRI